MGDKVEFTCLCGLNREVLRLQSRIPVETTICHCDSCRFNKGTLYYSSLPLTARPSCVPSLQSYQFSAQICRYFCSNCGTHICYHLAHGDSWHLSSGVVDRVVENEQVFGRLETIAGHQFVDDTKDGGLSVCLTGQSESSARRPLQGRHAPMGVQLKTTLSEAPRRHSRLRAACHCGGVEFFIGRPNEASRACSSPWPDLLRPYHLNSSANPDDEKWWISDSTRYLAGTCACRTCRLAFASPITCWAFIPKANLSSPDGSPFDFVCGTLKSYESSKDTYREFCSTCGASIFWHNKERPEVIDVGVGVLRAEEGSRAETWLDWVTERVSFSETAFDKDLIKRFETGLKELKKS